jgi:hypothetical protein
MSNMTKFNKIHFLQTNHRIRQIEKLLQNEIFNPHDHWN